MWYYIDKGRYVHTTFREALLPLGEAGWGFQTRASVPTFGCYFAWEEPSKLTSVRHSSPSGRLGGVISFGEELEGEAIK